MPFHDATFTVTQCGRICFNGQKVNLSHVFAAQNVGVNRPHRSESPRVTVMTAISRARTLSRNTPCRSTNPCFGLQQSAQ